MCWKSYRLTALVIILNFILVLSWSNPSQSIEHEAVNSVVEHVIDATPRIQADIQYLSDDERIGRGPNTTGLNEAADYIRKQFDEVGLTKPIADQDGFLEFTAKQGTSLGKEQLLEFTAPDGWKKNALLDTDYQVSTLGASGNVAGELVFVGYGISSPQKNYDDFLNVDVKGKIAVIFRKVPRHHLKDSLFINNGEMHTDHAPLNLKVKLLQERKAAGVIVLNDPTTVKLKIAELEDAMRVCRENLANTNLVADEKEKEQTKLQVYEKELATTQGDELLPFGYGGNGRGISIPVVQLSLKCMDEMLAKYLGKTTSDLEQAILQDLKPQSQVIPQVSVRLTTSVIMNKTELKNVIGVLEGTGDLKEETIVVGAHYDHVGMGYFGSMLPGSNQVHNGADDNASGTCGLLELARRFGSTHKNLPRRIVFIAFSGEEMGLLGSNDYTAHPMFPLKNTIAMFNLDMIGRVADNKITLFGTKTSTRWDGLLDQLSKRHQLNFVRKPEGFGPSDHSPFYKEKVPVLHFFTGLHGDYHRPSDDWEKINLQGISRVAMLLEEMILHTANTKEKPQYVDIPGRANVFNAAGTTPFLGTIPNLTYKGPGYKIASLTYDSPAIKPGMLTGDIITNIEGQPVVTMEDLHVVLNKFKGDQEVTIGLSRNEQTLSVKVVLSKPR